MRRSESLYRSLIDTMGEGLGIQDTKVLSHMSVIGCASFGVTSEEMIGRSGLNLWTMSTSKFCCPRRRLRKHGAETPYELEWTGHGGRIIPTKVSPKPILDDEGNYAGSFAVITDLTELKAAHKALETEKMKFETLCENLPFGVVLVGRKGEFLYANPAFRLMSGYKNEDIASGREWFNLAFPDPTQRGSHCYVEARLASQRSRKSEASHLSCEMQRRHGENNPFQAGSTRRWVSFDDM